MNLKMYTVFDAAVGAYLQPFFARSHGEALRSFQDAVNNDKAPFNIHPHDFSLFYVGGFDDNSGAIEYPTAPERLLSGTEALIKEIPTNR